MLIKLSNMYSIQNLLNGDGIIQNVKTHQAFYFNKDIFSLLDGFGRNIFDTKKLVIPGNDFNDIQNFFEKLVNQGIYVRDDNNESIH